MVRQLKHRHHDERERKRMVKLLTEWDLVDTYTWTQEHKKISAEVVEIAAQELADAHESGSVDWAEVATKILSHLDGFNYAVLEEQQAAELRRRNESDQEYFERKRTVEAALRQATERYQAGQFEDAIKVLNPFSPPVESRYVEILDLKCVELQLRCALHDSRLEPYVVDLESKLHVLAVGYVERFANALDSQVEQMLAVRLLDLLRNARNPPPLAQAKAAG